MKILIICTFYPPDSDIASVRPYMLAKYLQKRGHEITVLCSGNNQMKPDGFLPKLECVDVVTYLNSNPGISEANKRNDRTAEIKPRLAFLPKWCRLGLQFFYHNLLEANLTRKRLIEAKKNYKLQKQTLVKYADRQFDVVFSTYSNLENIFAGRYASKMFDATWVQDFRDPVTEYQKKNRWIWNIIGEKIHKYTIKHADICTAVSDGICELLANKDHNAIIRTIYNGYEPVSNEEVVPEKVLTICFTGSMYRTHYALFERLLTVIKELVDCKEMDERKLRFVYAGLDSVKVSKIFIDQQLADIFVDYGYVSREEVVHIQNQTDIFLVCAWNEENTKGVISGKFYEGIRAKKPILAMVAGNLPGSELYQMNNKYEYGFCYESCREKEMHDDFVTFLKKYYQEKTQTGTVSYKQSNELETTFRYDHIAEQLEKCINGYRLKNVNGERNKIS